MNTPIEDWMLTAYALGELDAADAAAVQQALQANDALREELADVRRTLARVESTLHASTRQPLPLKTVEAMRAALANSITAGQCDGSSAAAIVQPAAVDAKGGPSRLNIFSAAIAASLLVALIAAPGLMTKRGWMLSRYAPQSESARGDLAGVELSKEQSLERQIVERNEPFFESPVAQLEQEVVRNSSQGETSDEPRFVESMSGARPAISNYSLSPLSAVDAMEHASEPFALGLSAAVQPSADLDAYGPVSGGEAGTGSGGYGAPYGGAAPAQADFGFAGETSAAARGGVVAQDLYGERAAGPAEASPSAMPAGRGLTTRGRNASEVDYLHAIDGEAAKGVEEERLAELRQPRLLLQEESLFFREGMRQKVSGDRFAPIVEVPFKEVVAGERESQLTTFSIDVDTAAYSKVRQAIEAGSLPDPNAVRIEEMINYFDYDYAAPEDETPFSAALAAAPCPWEPRHKLVRVALQAERVEAGERPQSNLVFLIDVSGSMDEPNKLPLVKKSISMLARQLGENDRVAMVVYAGAAGLVLPTTHGHKQTEIQRAIDGLSAGGSTNGGEGIVLAYELAQRNFIAGGINRVLLCTDGDFNVGLTGDEALVRLVEQKARGGEKPVFLSVLGFGMGNNNDSMLEKITNSGNGFYAMIDGELEARRVMVERGIGTLMTVAKDVKVQIEFNPRHVAAYRQIGYENRALANRDFNDDTKDAGEVGAGHQVTALYEIVPVGQRLPSSAPDEDPLRYAAAEATPEQKPELDGATFADLPAELADEVLLVKLRYKEPEASESTKFDVPLKLDAYERPIDDDFRWASAIAQFGMLLRDSRYAEGLDWGRLAEEAQMAAGDDDERLEAVGLIRRAADLAPRR